MNIIIRQERSKDHPYVFNLIEEAFKVEKLSDQTEQFLVERLRKSKAFIPQLSIIAELEDKIVGHILLTKLKINDSDKVNETLALAPVTVIPEHQRKGIGGKLIVHAHQKAKELGYKSIILIGHENYYPKFGYRKASEFKIELPFPAPDENCMAIELVKDGLKTVQGMVEYPKEFSE